MGWDASGVVEQVGAAAQDMFSVGDEVYFIGSLLRTGSYAQYTLVDYRMVAKKPKNLDHIEAAGVPLSFLTAYEMLVECFGIAIPENDHQREQNRATSLLIIGGSGGVGSIATQLAKTILGIGTIVTTASRQETEQWSKNQGADFVVDHSKADSLAEQLKGITALRGGQVDNVFISSSTDFYVPMVGALLKPFGKIGLIVETHGPVDICSEGLMTKRTSIHWENVFTRSIFDVDVEKYGQDLQLATRAFEQGQLKPYVNRVFEYDQIKEAHTLQESGRSIGKIVVKMP